MKSTLPEVPKPDMGPRARFHATKLDLKTGLYSLHCQVCGKPEATAWAGMDGEYCFEHTPELTPECYMNFGRKPRTIKSNKVEI